MRCPMCYNAKEGMNNGFIYAKQRVEKGIDACTECAKLAETEYLTKEKDDDK